MSQTTFGDQPSPLAAPHQANGWPTALWAGEGFYPAGSGTRTTSSDMLRFAAAVLDGTAPGMAALEPVYRADDTSANGLGWAVETNPDTGRDMWWHNGGTGGSRTMLTVDRSAGTAAVVLSNSATDVDAIGFRLLDAPAESSTDPVARAIGWGVLGFALLMVGYAVYLALRGTALIPQVAAAATAVFAAGIALRSGPWDILPAPVPGALVGATVGAVVVIIARRLLTGGPPTWPDTGRLSAGINAGISVALAALAIAALV